MSVYCQNITEVIVVQKIRKINKQIFTKSKKPYFHTGDVLLQKQQWDMLDQYFFQGLKTEVLSPGSFSSVKKISNEESLLLKTHKKLSFSFQGLAVLSRDHHILKFRQFAS